MTIKLWHILAALGVMIVLLVYLTFSKSKSVPDYKGTIQAKNEFIDYIKQERVSDSIFFFGEIQRERRNADSLKLSFTQNQTKYKPLIQKYENIPISVRNLSKDSLRLAAYEAATSD